MNSNLINAERKQKALDKKNEGNENFSKGYYNRALNLYTEAMQLDSTNFTFPLNRSICYLKLDQWENCKKDCDLAIGMGLEIYQSSEDSFRKISKAFARYGEAYWAQGQYLPALNSYCITSSLYGGAIDSIAKVKRQVEANYKNLIEEQQLKVENFRQEQCLIDAVFIHPEQVRSSYECTICTQVFNNPVILSCGHTFCRGCIEDWLRHERSCPNCRASIPNTKLTPNLGLRDTVNALQVQCPHGFDGGPCGWTGEYGDLNKHLQTCRFVKELCFHPGCSETMYRSELRQHTENCPYKLKYCNDCQMKGHNQCDEGFPCAVLTCKCQRVFKPGDYYYHLHAECPQQLVRCPHSKHGCHQKLTREEMKQHISMCSRADIGALEGMLQKAISRVSTLEDTVHSQGEQIKELIQTNRKQEHHINDLQQRMVERENQSRRRSSGKFKFFS
eukprot:gb/GECH01000371.1/.p1 GENE.gb/GECH01000371.1/~~gb/GECH01000371.1/.p1  ORF type:complete len:446 (+),score=85.80 gb/GECH01000371.1/:1-1338(+)